MNHRTALTCCVSVLLCFAGCGTKDVAMNDGDSPPATTSMVESQQEGPQGDAEPMEPATEPATEPADAKPEPTQPANEPAAPAPTEPTAHVSAGGASPDKDAFWPCFHGPNRDNLSSDTGLLSSWPSDGPPLDWEVAGIGNGYSTVSIAKGLMYTVGNKDGQTMISAIDLHGNIQWQVANGPAYEKDYPGTRGTPTIDGDRLYHQSPVGNIVCLKADDGTQIWAANSLERFNASNIRWALAESMVIDGDHVITCPGGNEVSVAALNKMTGETVWKAESTGHQTSYATPSIAEFDGIRMILTMDAKSFIGVNADTGKLLFSHPFETKYDINALQPICHDGHVFISGGYGTTGSQLLKVIVDGDKASVELVWHSTELDNQHGGVVLLDGHLYGSAHSFNGGKWICLDWKTGEMKWAERGVGKGCLTYADGLLYTMSEKRKMGLAKATPDGFELVSDFRIPSGGSGASWAHPVVCGGRLYIRYDDKLFAYNVKAGG